MSSQFWCGAIVYASLTLAACDRERAAETSVGAPSSSVTSQELEATPAVSVGGATEAKSLETLKAEGASCPEGMQLVPGGEFWSGSAGTSGSADEHPRFRTRMHRFCLDRTEVTVAAYSACEAMGKCSSAAREVKTCNGGRDQRANHPINCATANQAAAFCSSLGKRLPTELEWEFAARGGPELRKFAWGSASPDGNTCWKRAGTCEVGQFAEEAFGLRDMNGNVWEWTDSFYGRYPWPARSGPTKVYRGGSWSRRFEKWLSLTLRNRFGPEKWGSHLGFRCAQLLALEDCPYGAGERGHCRHGVEEAECVGAHKNWNGVRCAAANEPPSEDGCANGAHREPGHGCVRDVLTQRHASKSIHSTAGVKTTRSPQFDVDCRTHQPKRPHAYRLAGGTHAGRNLVGRGRGCKNRDVGVGWNSACCP